MNMWMNLWAHRPKDPYTLCALTSARSTCAPVSSLAYPLAHVLAHTFILGFQYFGKVCSCSVYEFLDLDKFSIFYWEPLYAGPVLSWSHLHFPRLHHRKFHQIRKVSPDLSFLCWAPLLHILCKVRGFLWFVHASSNSISSSYSSLPSLYFSLFSGSPPRVQDRPPPDFPTVLA